jgi:twitching motility protein PilU
MWRLENDMSPVSRIVPKKEEPGDQASFTEITLDVRADPPTTSSGVLRRF